MTSVQRQAWNAGQADFDSFYRGESPTGGSMPFSKMPWDIGEPQPAVVRLSEEGRLAEHVLDVGCGLGENALYLASRGHHVVGVDGAGAPLEHARALAEQRGLDVSFVHGDATRLEGMDRQFGSVLDSALYHCLGVHQRRAYAAELHRVTVPGASLHLFCFADADSGGFGVPNHVSRDDLHDQLGEHWDIRSIEFTDYVNITSRQNFEDRLAEFDGMGIRIDLELMRFDERGRLLIPMWQLHAVRK